MKTIQKNQRHLLKFCLYIILSSLTFLLKGQVPINDLCNNAILLSSNNTCTPTNGTTTAAVESLYDPCAEFEKINVWYKFTASFATHTIQLTYGTITNAAIDVYTDGCSTLTPVNTCNFEHPGPVQTKIITSLTIGQEYLVAISNRETTEQGSFEICILNPPTPPINDNCIRATLLTPNSSNFPVNMTAGTTTSATQSSPACTGTADDDVWYKFVATHTNHRIYIKPQTLSFPVLQAYIGTCAALTSIACNSGNTTYFSLPLNNLVIGDTVFIRAHSLSNLSNTAGSFTIAITSPPTNNECANVETLLPGASGVAFCNASFGGATYDATSSMVACSAGGTPNDVWFNFSANQGVHNIKLKRLIGASQAVIEVFSGPCSTLASIYCTSHTFLGDSIIAKVGNLEAGQAYKIRIYNADLLFQLCISSPLFPANDVCQNAVTLIPSMNETFNFTSGNLTGASNSINMTSLCAAANNYLITDVWYKFTATDIQHKIKIRKISMAGGPLNYELFSNTCSSLSTIKCNAANDTIFGIGNLTIGSDYFIRVYTFNIPYAFEVAVNTPIVPSNDECATATTILPSPDANCNNYYHYGTVKDATQSLSDDCEAGNSGQVRDVWYQFVATSTSHRIRIEKGSITNFRYQLYSGTCSSLSSILCSVESNTIVNNRHDNLVVGNTYYVRILNEAPDVAGTFSICVRTVVVPSNNECANAIIITPQSSLAYGTVTSGSLLDATLSSQAAPTCSSISGRVDVWYSFTATQSDIYLSCTNTGSTNMGIVLYTGICTSLTQVKCISSNASLIQDNFTTLIVGQVYYVRVLHTVQSTFQILLSNQFPPIPSNDNCSNALQLFPTTNNNCISAVSSTVGATLSGQSSCINAADVWFKFTALSTSHKVLVHGPIKDLTFVVFSGTCASLNPLNVCNSFHYGLSQTISGLVVGQEYFIKVFSLTNIDNNQAEFEICITTPTAVQNINCNTATPLVTLPSKDTSNQTWIALNTANIESWYSFTATHTEMDIEIQHLQGLITTGFFRGSCSNLVTLTPTFNQKTINLKNLIVGEAIYGIIYTNSTSTQREFRMGIYGANYKKESYSIDSLCLENNLVLNPSLEQETNFPLSFTSVGIPNTELIDNWFTPTEGTPDFFNAKNAYTSSASTYHNLCLGSQRPRSGMAYGGFFAFSKTYREYLAGKLSSPVIIGKKYLISAWFSLSEYSNIATHNLGIALSVNPISVSTSTPLNIDPVVESTTCLQNILDKEWVNVSAVIIADSAYQNIILGNFNNVSNSDTSRVSNGRIFAGGTYNCMQLEGSSYYFADDVMVAELDTSSICNNSVFWTGLKNQNWNEPCNWSSNAVPNETSVVVIPSSPRHKPALDGGRLAIGGNFLNADYKCNKLLVFKGGKLVSNGSIIDNHSFITVDGVIEIKQ